jgi:signal transduction histidine kinase
VPLLTRLPLGIRFLLIALGTVVIPLVLTVTWLTLGAGAAGEALLRSRMSDALEEMALEVASAWPPLRSRILDLVEDPAVLETLRVPVGEEAVLSGSERARAALKDALETQRDHTELFTMVEAVHLEDPSGHELGRLMAEGATEERLAGFSIPVEARDPLSGVLMGTVRVRLQPEVLLPRQDRWTARTGGFFGIIDPQTGRLSSTSPVTWELLARTRFTLDGEEWITHRRQVTDPPVILLLAAPVNPFALPFEEAAWRGLILVLAVAVLGFVAAAFLTHQATRALQGLAGGAEAISRGELAARVREEGPGEVIRAARAFNAMAERLETTLDSLAKREGLAAVGEFAATLAHELRNPLTAIRLDLHRLEELAGASQEERQTVVDRILKAAGHLDRSVEGVLRVAGTGRGRFRRLELGGALRKAMELTATRLREEGVFVRLPPEGEKHFVMGDDAALEQLFANLLLNAAQSMGRMEGGEVRAQVRDEQGIVVVAISDSGEGVPEEVLKRLREPLFTTRARGTGLGLAIADRIVRAHGGSLSLVNRKEGGARAEVRLPAA